MGLFDWLFGRNKLNQQLEQLLAMKKENAKILEIILTNLEAIQNHVSNTEKIMKIGLVSSVMARKKKKSVDKRYEEKGLKINDSNFSATLTRIKDE